MNLSFFIARRYLAKQKGTFSSFIIRLSVIATALSVAVMIVAMAIVTGFNHSIVDKLFSFVGHVHVVPYDITQSSTMAPTPVRYDESLKQNISRLPHVRLVAPFAQLPVILQVHGQIEGLMLKGVDRNYRFLSGISTAGAPITYNDSTYAKQIMLSQATADRMKVNMGDTVQLDFIQDGIPRIRRVVVCGTYHSGMEEVDKVFGVCDLKLLQRINNWPADSINGYQVDLDDAVYADTVASYIRTNLTKAPMEAYTSMENYDFIFEWLQLQSQNGIILLTIMALVAIINMGAVLLILMVDRAGMIGLLKALGMTFEATRNVFLSIAGITAAAGILLGNIIALTLCWLQQSFGLIKLPEETYYMSHVPVQLVWWHVVMIDVVTLVLCIICMWLPALYIRRIQPARVLQFR